MSLSRFLKGIAVALALSVLAFSFSTAFAPTNSSTP